jgi:hypothetical protein
MLWTVFVILLALWLLGLTTSDTAGGFIHILVFVGVAVVLKKVIQDRRILQPGRSFFRAPVRPLTFWWLFLSLIAMAAYASAQTPSVPSAR